MCSGRASWTVELAAGQRRPRRGRWPPRPGRGRRGGRAGRSQRAGLDAVDDDGRRADALDLGAHRVQEVAQVDDLGLAGRVVEHRGALGVDGGHDDVLGGADARELERDVGAPQPRRRAPRGSRGAARTARRGPRGRAGACRSGGARSRRRRAGTPGPGRSGRAAGRAPRSTPGSARPARRAPPARCSAELGRAAAGRGARGSRRSERTPTAPSRSLMMRDVGDARARCRARRCPRPGWSPPSA